MRFKIALLTLFVGLFFWFDYHELVFERPQGIHRWRQTDCASIALRYHQDDLPFHQPQIHAYVGDGGESCQVATSEVPYFYYGMAKLYDIFGYHEWLYRALNTLIFFLGLYWLGQMASRVLIRPWSWIAPILLMNSAVLAYYGSNFLSNTTALAFAMGAMNAFMAYKEEQRRSQWWTFVVLAMIAGASKLPGLFLPATMGVLWLIDLFRKEDKMVEWPKWSEAIVGWVLIVLPAAAWAVYASRYNDLHNTAYFSTTVFPITDFSWSEIQEILRDQWLNFGKDYFPAMVYVFTILMLILALWKQRGFWRLSTLVLLALFTVFYLLQFWTFRDHDYYLINAYFIVAWIWLAGLTWAFSKATRVGRQVLSGLLAILAIVGLGHSKERLEHRYSNVVNDYQDHQDFYSIEPYLRSIGIERSDRVVAFDDFSHANLYLMNQLGNTGHGIHRVQEYGKDAEMFRKYVDLGAKYLLVNGLDVLDRRPYLKDYTKTLLGRYKHVFIFDLLDLSGNFEMPEQELNLIEQPLITMDTALWRIENLDSSGVVTISKEHRYPLLRRLNVEDGQKVIFSLETDNVESMRIIGSGEDSSEFYKWTNSPAGESGEWTTVELIVNVPVYMHGKDIVFYASMEGDQEVLIRNVNFRVYKSLYADEPILSE